MSGYIEQNDYWNQNPGAQQDSYNFEMPVQQDFQQELNFQTFETTDPTQKAFPDQNIYGGNPYLNPTTSYGGNIFTPSTADQGFERTGDEFEDEPPLLEELGINPDFILQKELQEYLDSAENGLIYFSLGSNVKSSLMPEQKMKTILNVFAQLPYKVLWKFEADLEGLPANVKIMKWLPQQDILRHQNVKLFITQGGLQSIDEAIHCGVPLLGIPFFGDQFHNIKRSTHLGIGLDINFDNFSEIVFKNTIIEVITNKTYRTKIQELSNLVRDQPINPLDKAIWWIEYVIRHKGAQHLQSPAVHMPFYQYYLLDVIGTLFFASVLLLYLFIRMIKLITASCKNFLRRAKLKMH